MDFNKFKILHSETIMFCQIIENDIKRIYAYMHEGDIKQNFEDISDQPLGQSVRILKKLDNEDGKPNISSSDYNFLSQMAEKRNYWCHQNYIDFIYSKSNLNNSISYQKVSSKLENDYKKLGGVYKKLEQVRIKIEEKYRR